MSGSSPGSSSQATESFSLCRKQLHNSQTELLLRKSPLAEALTRGLLLPAGPQGHHQTRSSHTAYEHNSEEPKTGAEKLMLFHHMQTEGHNRRKDQLDVGMKTEDESSCQINAFDFSGCVIHPILLS